MACDILETRKNGIRTIQLNNPSRKNALSPKHYLRIAKILSDDTNSAEILATIITGTGEYFTSGNDLSAALLKAPGNNSKLSTNEHKSTFHMMVDAFIQYPKLLIAIINGPAIGIGVTMCALCDLVFCSDKATFLTPFVKVGLTAEACSSFLLPQIMGQTRANEMLLLGRKFSAKEAFQSNLVSSVIPQAELDCFKEKLHRELEKINLHSLMINKTLIKDGLNESFFDTYHRENIALRKAVKSETFQNNIKAFMSRKNKL